MRACIMALVAFGELMKMCMLPLVLLLLFTLAACASSEVKREPKATGEHANHLHG